MVLDCNNVYLITPAENEGTRGGSSLFYSPTFCINFTTSSSTCVALINSFSLSKIIGDTLESLRSKVSSPAAVVVETFRKKTKSWPKLTRLNLLKLEIKTKAKHVNHVETFLFLARLGRLGIRTERLTWIPKHDKSMIPNHNSLKEKNIK